MILSKPAKTLHRSQDNKKIAGVCGGLGEYFVVDPTLIRIIFVIFVLCSVGLGVLVYFIMWLIMPKAPKARNKKRLADEQQQE